MKKKLLMLGSILILMNIFTIWGQAPTPKQEPKKEKIKKQEPKKEGKEEPKEQKTKSSMKEEK